MPVTKIFLYWLKARRAVLFYIAAVFGFFFWVYALHDYEWSVAGYAALLGIALGAALCVWDFIRFALKHKSLSRLKGRFPVENFPEPGNLLERHYQEIAAGLEAERLRLEKESERARRDAEEYYTLCAHQIKTPLSAAQLVLQRRAGGRGHINAGEIEQELFRIGQYVEMVLQYQRLSSIENDLALARFEVSCLVRKAAKNTATLFIHRGLALDAERVSGGIVTDEKWFCFVLEQLLANAVKYTRDAVSVYTRGDELVIADNGMGIPAEDLPRVFERGFTGTVGRAERSSTGIGLYLCKRVLNRLGFKISIESETGKGTRAVLNLSQKDFEAD
ncbi:MAG: sensor histidine kinase [Clostridiales bacterium]|jgi:signal transduction histidine kinase|nr:sensor histidine kinase [Clostridiales bacterium]